MPKTGYTEGVLIEVAVPSARFQAGLTYAVPEALRARVRAGVRVEARLQRRRVVGVVMGEASAYDRARLIEAVIDDAPLVSEAQLELARFVARYYRAPLGEAVRLVLPPGSETVIEHRFQVSEAGKVARVFGAAHKLDKRDIEALAIFEDGVRKTAAQLKRQGVTARRLERLTERGLVEEIDPKALAKPRITERFVALEGGGDIPGRATSAIALDAWLRVQPLPPTFRDVSIAFPSPRDKLKRLEALGRLEVRRETRSPAILPALEVSAVERLTPDQSAAVNAILAADAAGKAFLLEGVTGSGKTEVYLEVLRALLADGRGAIFVVPEIALTPQLFARVQRRLGAEVALLHSGLTAAERRDAWARLGEGKARVVVGARSAVFAPVRDLGLIVVDEEHEPSLKQEDNPRYHARDVALWRARREGARVILGSATPALETRENAARGKLVHLELPTRVHDRALPEVRVVDLRERRSNYVARLKDRPLTEGTPDAILSGPLAEALEDTVARGDQALLFLNRRGWASVTLCEACGAIYHCHDCSVSMTLHRTQDGSRAWLICHQCGHRDDFSTGLGECRECGEGVVVALGLGTERLEAEVRAKFPHIRVARLDRDAASTTKQVTRVLQQVQRGEVDVLVGTQMVAKGHDFPRISLVGVVLADIALGLPDYRASERAFTLLTQVAGRAGRGIREGRVIVQTYNPTHPAVTFAASHDVKGFAAAEREGRRAARYPPFSRLALVRFSGEDGHAVNTLASLAAERLRAAAARVLDEGAWDVLGPAPCAIERIRGQTRYQMLLRTGAVDARATLCDLLDEDEQLSRDLGRAKVRVVVDIDPVSML
jgi:primosomal protein N' (replication factor Y)